MYGLSSNQATSWRQTRPVLERPEKRVTAYFCAGHVLDLNRLLGLDLRTDDELHLMPVVRVAGDGFGLLNPKAHESGSSDLSSMLRANAVITDAAWFSDSVPYPNTLAMCIGGR